MQILILVLNSFFHITKNRIIIKINNNKTMNKAQYLFRNQVSYNIIILISLELDRKIIIILITNYLIKSIKML